MKNEKLKIKNKKWKIKNEKGKTKNENEKLKIKVIFCHPRLARARPEKNKKKIRLKNLFFLHHWTTTESPFQRLALRQWRYEKWEKSFLITNQNKKLLKGEISLLAIFYMRLWRSGDRFVPRKDKGIILVAHKGVVLASLRRRS